MWLRAMVTEPVGLGSKTLQEEPNTPGCKALHNYSEIVKHNVLSKCEHDRRGWVRAQAQHREAQTPGEERTDGQQGLHAGNRRKVLYQEGTESTERVRRERSSLKNWLLPSRGLERPRKEVKRQFKLVQSLLLLGWAGHSLFYPALT